MGELPGAPVCILKVCTETMNRSNGVVAQIMLLLPQGVHILIPRMCECCLTGRKVSADAISRWGDCPVLSKWVPQASGKERGRRLDLRQREEGSVITEAEFGGMQP